MPKVLEMQHKAGYESFWGAIRSLKVFTHQDVMCEIGKEFGDRVNGDTLKSYIQRLCRGGYVVASGYVPTARGTRYRQYTLVNDTGVRAPRLRSDGTPSKNGAVHEALWVCMKVLGNFHVRELKLAATTERTSPSEEETADYCEHLARAGYLRRNGNGCHYTFIRSRFTGPRPPVVTYTSTVYDPNTRQIVFVKELEISV